MLQTLADKKKGRPEERPEVKGGNAQEGLLNHDAIVIPQRKNVIAPHKAQAPWKRFYLRCLHDPVAWAARYANAWAGWRYFASSSALISARNGPARSSRCSA